MKFILATAVLLSSINAVYSFSSAKVECALFNLKGCNDAINKAEDIEIFADDIEGFSFNFQAYFLGGCATFQQSLKKIRGCELCNLTHTLVDANAIYCDENKDDDPAPGAASANKAT